MRIRSGRRRWAVVVVAVVALAAAVGVVAIRSGGAARSGGGRPGPRPVSTGARPAPDAGPAAVAAAGARSARSAAAAWARLPDTGWIATLHVAVPWSARPGGPTVGTLPAVNPYGTAMVLAVVGAPGRDGWARVELPMRPNASTGWIRWGATRLQRTTYTIAVDLTARTLTVVDGGRPVLTTPVAVGAPATPTPTGSTYVWELVRPTDPDGAYGPDILGLALFSDAYSTFDGGEAQIGIHGSDDPASIGQDVSNGCVRLPDAVVARLAGIVPLGTPVTITA